MKWCRVMYHQCNVWVIIFLKQTNDFHGFFSTSLLLQKIVWAAYLVGETMQIACIQGMNMRVYCRIQLLEAPMPSKD